MNEPGTYVVTADGKDHTVEADSYDYQGDGGSMRMLKSGAVVAEFRYWSSVIRKGD